MMGTVGVKRNLTTWLAWSVWAVSVLVGLATIPLVIVNSPDFAAVVTFTALVDVIYVTAGALIVWHRPEHSIGWLMAAAGICTDIGNFGQQYGAFTLITSPGALPGGVWAAWAALSLQGASWGVLVLFLPLLFPTGRLPSRRWRPVAWLAGAYVGVQAIFLQFVPGSLARYRRDFPDVPNPFGVDALDGAFRVQDALNTPMTLLALLACGSALVWRWRHAPPLERQQLKWFAFALALPVLLFGATAPFEIVGQPIRGPLGNAVFIVPIAGFAVAVCIAVLRYRLYEIDLLINRTLVYAALTATLALVYWAAVIVLQQLLRPFTQGSDLAIVGSTLAVAALFQPARRRIQETVDRRFYRRKYDAQLTLQQFSARLRQEIELDSLSAELQRVVRQSVQPDRVWLWLRRSTGQTPPRSWH